jgi:hypothetical protein
LDVEAALELVAAWLGQPAAAVVNPTPDRQAVLRLKRPS